MELWRYVKSLLKYFWALLGSAVFTVISLYANLENESNHWIVRISIVAAVLLVFVATFLAWNDEHKRLEEEISRRSSPDVILDWQSDKNVGKWDRVRLRNIGNASAFKIELCRFSWPELSFTVPLLVNAIHPNDPEVVGEPRFVEKLPSGITNIGHLHLDLRSPRFKDRQPLEVTVRFLDSYGTAFERSLILEPGDGGDFGPSIRVTPGKLTRVLNRAL
jgi:hypothetical protein